MPAAPLTVASRGFPFRTFRLFLKLSEGAVNSPRRKFELTLACQQSFLQRRSFFVSQLVDPDER
jgi:hypothetical protein